MIMRKTIVGAATIAAGVAAASLPATAQQTINLTALSGYPPPATFVGALINAYLPAVDAELAKTGKFKSIGIKATAARSSGRVVNSRVWSPASAISASL